MDGPELSGDDRSITSDIQDATEANLDHDSMDSDREALNLVGVSYFSSFSLVPRLEFFPATLPLCEKLSFVSK